MMWRFLNTIFENMLSRKNIRNQIVVSICCSLIFFSMHGCPLILQVAIIITILGNNKMSTITELSEASFPLTSSRKTRALFQACAIDADCAVKPDGQNSVISFVISKWLLPELLLSHCWSRGKKPLGTRLQS